MDRSVVPVTQLAVLAAIVDGHASAEELDTIAAGVSAAFGAPPEKVRSIAEGMLAAYTEKKLSENPVALVRRGEQALKQLDGRSRRRAMQIARDVAEATDGVEASEADFINQLMRYSLHL